MNARRSFLTTSALVVPAVAVAGCTQIKDLVSTAGTAAGAGAIAQIVSYLQSAVSALETILATFASSMKASAKTTADAALGALSSAAGAFGSAVTSGASATAAASTLSGIENLLSAAVTAIVAGLSAVPVPNPTFIAALAIAKEVQSLVPTIVAFVNGLVHPATGPATSARSIPPAVKTLGVMAP